RRHAQQHFALGEPLADEPEIAVLEVAQSAVDQLARSRGRCAGDVALLAEQHRETAPSGVAGDPDPVDAAADDKQVEDFAHDNSASANSTKPAPASRSAT